MVNSEHFVGEIVLYDNTHLFVNGSILSIMLKGFFRGLEAAAM